METRARAPTSLQPGEVLVDERVDARALQADRVEHPATGSRPSAACRGRTAGAAITDLVTNAPSSQTSKNRCSSRPFAAQPDAVISGFGRVDVPPSVAPYMSTAISGHLTRGGADRVGGHPAEPSANASQRTRSPRKTGPSTHERTIRVAPSGPVTGITQVMQTPMPQAIDSSTATWATAPSAVGDVGDRLEHAHRAAAVDDGRAGCAGSPRGRTSVTQPLVPAEPSSVVT